MLQQKLVPLQYTHPVYLYTKTNPYYKINCEKYNFFQGTRDALKLHSF